MKKKVIYIAPHLSTGGMPQYLYKEMELLQNDFDIYCIEWGDVTGGVLVVQRNKIKNLLGNRLLTLGENKWELFDVVKRIQPDVIHLQEIPELFMPYDIANILYDKNRPYTIIETSHDSSTDPNQKRHFPDKFLFVSQYQLELYKSLGIPSDVVEYPIESFQRTKTKEEAQRFLGMDPNLKHVVNIGLFTPRKNQAEIVEYAKALKDHPIQFHFIGNHADNFRYYWEPIMKDFPSNCKWWNERTDVENFYQAADLFLFTSRGNNTDKETMPLVIREAISWQVPSLIYNLTVYQNYFDKYKNISYLNEKSKEENEFKILTKLNVKNKSVFFTMNGEEDLQNISYPNSTWDTLQKYGDAAAQYFATYILKELEPNDFLIEKDSVFVDLGANIGMSSRYAKEKGAKEIWCFEPDPNLLKVIQKNVPDAKTFQYAIGEELSNIELYHWPFNPVNQGPKYKVDSISLKKVLSIVNKKIDYLKIDIEGYEEGIFDNLTKEECSKIKKMFLEHHNPDTTAKLISTLESKGFNLSVQYGMGQNYIYAKHKNYMESKNENYGIESSWNAAEQKMYYWANQSINFPTIICLREYQSDAVLWAFNQESMPAGIQFWIMPISKEHIDYEKDELFTGIKICIYNKETDEQIYEKPFYNKFVNKPNVRLSNFIPYEVNYKEFYLHHKYDKWLAKKYKTVIDVGANVGVFSQYMIENGFAENILAIECDSLALKDLQNNFRISDRVKVIPKALHYETTPIKLYESDVNPVITSTISPEKLEHHNAGVKGDKIKIVETITIPEIAEMYEKIDLLKIDIEGAEYGIIFNTDKKYFEKVDNLLIECHFFEKDCVEKYKKLLNTIEEFGYEIEEFVENLSDKHIGASEAIFCKKKEKTIFIIDAYIDNTQKENTIKKCIESIKPLGYDMLITTHKQIKEDISNMVDYVIFDKDNTLNEINFYTGYNQSYQNFDLDLWTTPDMKVKSHEFPIIKSIKNALNFAKESGYTKFIFTEFDSIFSENDLKKIKNMLKTIDYKKFIVFKNGEDGYDTIFFTGDISFFLNKFNQFFPKTIEEYNKKFTYDYPYRLEYFMYKMLSDSLKFGSIIENKFSEYFDNENKNLFRIGSYNAYIVPDQNNNNHICVQNLNNVECNVEVFVNGKIVYNSKLLSVVKNAYLLQLNDKEIKCVFKENENVLKEINLIFDNTFDYSKNGKLFLKW